MVPAVFPRRSAGQIRRAAAGAESPRTRKIYDREKWTGYDVVLDVLPELFAWGVLLLPKDMKPGERRPVVVCQHGRRGVPQDVIEGDMAAYHDFAARLANRASSRSRRTTCIAARTATAGSAARRTA